MVVSVSLIRPLEFLPHEKRRIYSHAIESTGLQESSFLHFRMHLCCRGRIKILHLLAIPLWQPCSGE